MMLPVPLSGIGSSLCRPVSSLAFTFVCMHPPDHLLGTGKRAGDGVVCKKRGAAHAVRCAECDARRPEGAPGLCAIAAEQPRHQSARWLPDPLPGLQGLGLPYGESWQNICALIYTRNSQGTLQVLYMYTYYEVAGNCGPLHSRASLLHLAASIRVQRCKQRGISHERCKWYRMHQIMAKFVYSQRNWNK